MRLGDAPHYWPEVDRIRVDAYVAGSEGDEFDMIAARNAIHAALAARQPVGISADWVLGYLTTDAPEESREAIRNAFAEYAALSGARQPVGEPVGYACTNCDRTDEVVICQTCAGMAWDNGRLHEFHEVRELSTSLGEGVLDHLLPDEWHEKPLLRFQGAFDEGDDSVGISPVPPMSWPTIRPALCWATTSPRARPRKVPSEHDRLSRLPAAAQP